MVGVATTLQQEETKIQQLVKNSKKDRRGANKVLSSCRTQGILFFSIISRNM